MGTANDVAHRLMEGTELPREICITEPQPLVGSGRYIVEEYWNEVVVAVVSLASRVQSKQPV